MNLGTLSYRSLLSRRWTVLLTVFSIAVSVLLVLGVDRLRNDARSSFANTVSGTDLIVGARTGSVQLLLYSVFRIGNATNNISWKSYTDFAADRRVAWTIPLALGDSHKGYRVLGTTPDYFTHYRYAGERPLRLSAGAPFARRPTSTTTKPRSTPCWRRSRNPTPTAPRRRRSARTTHPWRENRRTPTWPLCSMSLRGRER